ncbi:LPXTG cell wall anchor domain-containing protein [Lactococcus formosensis]|uniref:LPXTG cell wall anchor domain-containing protein n=1 Tax=Lactococcus formosensis TaxID=1281486 RepID=A0A9Q8Y0M5_9LACT|nr:LPXTG cell wall anchor domain-containing protein [Lactococcus formosensis]USJ19833.1 LPXTG cell wall anchor domain-containing protein [Lactococcus formosensis]
MKKILKGIVFLSTVTVYIVGNNQIASADTVANMESQASIHFDQSYFPPEVDPVIPSGSTSFPVYTGKSTLPKTGETGSQSGQLLGITLLSTSLLLIGLNKTKKENIKN